MKTATLTIMSLVLPLLASCAHAMQYETISVEAPFAMPPIRVPIFPDRDFSIADFGAQPDDQERNTRALAEAIAACSQAGGGRVVVPSGTWKTGAIHLRSHVNLHLESGAKLLFSGEPRDYLPAVRTSWEGYDCYNYSPLIYAYNCENVAITGSGTLEADLTTWSIWFARPAAHMEALKALYTMCAQRVPVEKRQKALGENNLRPPFVQFYGCRDVLLEDFSLRQSPFWCVHLLRCESVVARRLDIRAHGHNSDGIDPEMSKNVLIEDCVFDQGDDAIVLKAGSNQDAWDNGVPCENIVIRRCSVVAGHQLVAIGSELSAGVRNVYVHDCHFLSHERELFNVLFLKTNHRRGGFIENIWMENVSATKVRDSVLGIETDVLYQWRDLVPTYETRLTPIHGVYLKNVDVAQTGLQPFRILGDARLPVRDVTLENVRVERAGQSQNLYQHAENVREIDVWVGALA